jgi:selenocysteine lyase/cysteine desulfurase
VHLDNARASLMPAAVVDTVTAHLELEAAVGAAEAADQRTAELARVRDAAAALVNADPDEVRLYTDGALDVLLRARPYVADLTGSVGRVPVDLGRSGRVAAVARAEAYLRAPAGTGFLVLRGAELGRPNGSAAALLGLGRAIEYARAWGIEAIARRVEALATELHERLVEIPRVSARAEDGVVDLALAARDPRDVAWALRKRAITVSVNGGSVRASPHYFNDEDELAALAAVVAGL